jgi:hypothetical protein
MFLAPYLATKTVYSRPVISQGAPGSTQHRAGKGQREAGEGQAKGGRARARGPECMRRSVGVTPHNSLARERSAHAELALM